MELIRKVWAFLSALFWLERLDRLAREKRWFVFKLLPWMGRLSLFVYILGILSFGSVALLRPTTESLVMFFVSIIFFPLAYRFTMIIQIKFHSLIGW